MKKSLLAVVLVAPLMASANLVTNGSFESGLVPWVIAGVGIQPAVITYLTNTLATYNESIPVDNAGGFSPDAAGTKGLYFVDDTSGQAVSQSFALVAGTPYRAGFDYYATMLGALNANNATLTGSIIPTGGGAPVASAVVNLGFVSSGTWVNLPMVFPASVPSGNYTFQFSFAAFGVPAKDIVVDRAFVTVVPEPETYGMMLAGLLAVAAIVRRRSSRV